MTVKSALSNVDLIRRFVFENQPVTVDEIAAEVRANMHSVRDDETARERYVLPVLKAQPYYAENDGKWTVVLDKMPEYSVLPNVLQDAKKLLYEREIRSKVASKLGWKVLTVVLDLEKVDYLERHGAHWGLKEWTIANDQAAEVLKQHPGGLSEPDLLKTVCERHKLDPKKTILHLAGDKKKRFKQDRKVWLLKEDFDKKQTQQQPKAAKLPEVKPGLLNLDLEGSFLEATTAKLDELKLIDDKQQKTRLRKVLKKQAQEVLEQREDMATRSEDFAAKLSKMLSAAGVEEYKAKSYQLIEHAAKERSLSAREREEIQQFLDQMLELETVGVGSPLASVVNAPLSARKVQDVLSLKYINYSRDRAVIPQEYYRFLIEILHPTIKDSLLNPAGFEGNLVVEALNYLYDHLEGGAWALVEDESNLELVQTDGQRYQLGSYDPQLIEKARDKFIVSQVDLLKHFVNYKLTAIESDKVLARAARIITRLSGFESAYIVSNDYFSELPEVFGLAANEDNSIPHRFDFVMGNFTFVGDANLAANYLDQSLKLLSEGGRLGVFVLEELMHLLKEHGLLTDFLEGIEVTHYIRLPIIEGQHKVLLLVMESVAQGAGGKDIITTEISDFKSASLLSHALIDAESGASGMFERQPQSSLSSLIG
jgi:hypothetical protein